MPITTVFKYLNTLVADNVIQDYAIAGGYASMYYTVPMASYDLDVIVLLSSEIDYHNLYHHFTEQGAKIENVYIYIDNMPVQFLPNYISPLFNDAVENAITVDYDGVRVHYVSPEHLVLLFLTPFRDKDKIRIRYLIDNGIANKKTVVSLIERFDNEKDKLLEKYNKVLAKT